MDILKPFYGLAQKAGYFVPLLAVALGSATVWADGSSQIEGFQDIKLGMSEDQLLKDHPELKFNSKGSDAKGAIKWFKGNDRDGDVNFAGKPYTLLVATQNGKIIVVSLSSATFTSDDMSCTRYLDELAKMIASKYGKLDGPPKIIADENWAKTTEATKTSGDRQINIGVVFAKNQNHCTAIVGYGAAYTKEENPL